MTSRKVFFRTVDRSGAYGLVPGVMRKPTAATDTTQVVKEKKSDLPVTVQDRIRELMRTLMEQEPYRGRGAITRLANALKVSQPAVTQILSGGGVSLDTAMAVADLAKVDPRELLGGAYLGVAVGGRFPRLEVCLAYHLGRWNEATVAAARAGAFDGDVMPDEWALRLDRLGDAIAKVRKERPSEHVKGAR